MVDHFYNFSMGVIVMGLLFNFNNYYHFDQLCHCGNFTDDVQEIV